jgi:hypothetical protein
VAYGVPSQVKHAAGLLFPTPHAQLKFAPAVFVQQINWLVVPE